MTPRRRARVSIAVVLVALDMGTAAQTPAPPRDTSAPRSAPIGTAVLRGRVVRADTGQPLRRVEISATPIAADGTRPLVAVTNDAGQYELRDLPPGTYSVKASRTGFLTLGHGQTRPFEPGRPTVVAAGATVDRVDFALPAAGAVSGRVLDEAGEPITGADVHLLRYQFKNGTSTLTSAAGAANPTDDLGQFRIGGVPPGEYYLSAGPSVFGIARGEFDAGFTRTYYPGTAAVGNAQKIAIGRGQEVSGLVFPVVRARLATISGLVLGSDGLPATSGRVSLSVSSFSGSSGTYRQLTDGRFEYRGVPPGDYSLEARLDSPSGRELASTQVTLAGTDANVTFTLQRAVQLRGRVTFAGSAGDALRFSSVRVTAVSPSGVESLLNPYLPVRDDWTFEGTASAGWRSLLRVTAPEGWTASRITAGGRDLTDNPVEFVSDLTDIEVVLTNCLTTISGAVRDARGTGLPDAAVVVFADDPQKWGPFTRYVRSGRLDQTGRFTIRGLPPGRYQAVALERLEEGAEGDPALLARLRGRGIPVVLGEGEARAVDLQVFEAR
jgi:protocatechuate 3,4-dioxygenase beta subunit